MLETGFLLRLPHEITRVAKLWKKLAKKNCMFRSNSDFFFFACSDVEVVCLDA